MCVGCLRVSKPSSISTSQHQAANVVTAYADHVHKWYMVCEGPSCMDGLGCLDVPRASTVHASAHTLFSVARWLSVYVLFCTFLLSRKDICMFPCPERYPKRYPGRCFRLLPCACRFLGLWRLAEMRAVPTLLVCWALPRGVWEVGVWMEGCYLLECWPLQTLRCLFCHVGVRGRKYCYARGSFIHAA